MAGARRRRRARARRSPCSSSSSSTSIARAGLRGSSCSRRASSRSSSEPLASGEPIYVDFDDRGAQAQARWRAAVAGVPQDRIVILPDGGIPPPGSLVFLRFQDCDFACEEVASWEEYRLVRVDRLTRWPRAARSGSRRRARRRARSSSGSRRTTRPGSSATRRRSRTTPTRSRPRDATSTARASRSTSRRSSTTRARSSSTGSRVSSVVTGADREVARGFAAACMLAAVLLLGWLAYRRHRACVGGRRDRRARRDDTLALRARARRVRGRDGAAVPLSSRCSASSGPAGSTAGARHGAPRRRSRSARSRTCTRAGDCSPRFSPLRSSCVVERSRAGSGSSPSGSASRSPRSRCSSTRALIPARSRAGSTRRRSSPTTCRPGRSRWRGAVNYLQDLQVWHYVVSGDVKPYAHTPGDERAPRRVARCFRSPGSSLVLIAASRPIRSGATRSQRSPCRRSPPRATDRPASTRPPRPVRRDARRRRDPGARGAARSASRAVARRAVSSLRSSRSRRSQFAFFVEHYRSERAAANRSLRGGSPRRCSTGLGRTEARCTSTTTISSR